MKDPLILLKTYLEETAKIKLRDSTIVEGKLICFDEHFNICVKDKESEKLILIRGENVMFVSQ